MDLEFTTQLKDGRYIALAATVTMQYDCDCGGGELHPHVQDVHIDTALVLPDPDALEGPELSKAELLALDPELDNLISDEAYEHVGR